jgi:DNA end-binding protein Ku
MARSLIGTIDSRDFEKPYYLLPDGDSADEDNRPPRPAGQSKKLAIGQLIMHAENTLSASRAKKGLMLLILRYQTRYESRTPISTASTRGR